MEIINDILPEILLKNYKIHYCQKEHIQCYLAKYLLQCMSRFTFLE